MEIPLCLMYFISHEQYLCLMNNILVGDRILKWQLFSLSPLKIALHCFLAPIISVENSGISLIIVPLNIRCLFSSAYVQQFYCEVPTFGTPCMYYAWGLLHFSNSWLDVFHQFWKILSLAKLLHSFAALASILFGQIACGGLKLPLAPSAKHMP